MNGVLVQVLGPVITGIFTLIGVIVSNNYANNKTQNQIKTAQAVTDVKIDNLTSEVRTHNNFAQRIPVLEEQMKVANHRIDDLEKSERREK